MFSLHADYELFCCSDTEVPLVKNYPHPPTKILKKNREKLYSFKKFFGGDEGVIKVEIHREGSPMRGLKKSWVVFLPGVSSLSSPFAQQSVAATVAVSASVRVSILCLPTVSCGQMSILPFRHHSSLLVCAFRTFSLLSTLSVGFTF